jgi:protein-tyrosine-phosphatase
VSIKGWNASFQSAHILTLIQYFPLYSDDKKPIQDPYYGGDHGFQAAYKQCVRYSQAFLDHLGLETSKI